MSTDVIFPPVSASTPRIAHLPAGSARVEGRLLLKQRDALRGVNSQQARRPPRTTRQAALSLEEDAADGKSATSHKSPRVRANGIRRKSPKQDDPPSERGMIGNGESRDSSAFPLLTSQSSSISSDGGTPTKSPVSRSSKQRRSLKDTLYHLIRSPASSSEDSSLKHSTSLSTSIGDRRSSSPTPTKQKEKAASAKPKACSPDSRPKSHHIFSGPRLRKSNSFAASRARLILRRHADSSSLEKDERTASSKEERSQSNPPPQQPEIKISHATIDRKAAQRHHSEQADGQSPNEKPQLKPKPSRPVNRSYSERTPSRLFVVRQLPKGSNKGSSSSRGDDASSATSSDYSGSDGETSPHSDIAPRSASRKEKWAKRRQGAFVMTSADDSDTAMSENDILNASSSDVCAVEDECTVTEGPVLFQEWRVIKTDQLAGSPVPNSQPVWRKGQQNKHGKALQRMNSSLRSSMRKKRDWNAMRWINEPVVVSSSIVKSLSAEEVQLQERYFEVITSERSYNESMKVFINHFMGSDALTPGQPGAVVDASIRKRLMSNANTLLALSNRFLAELESELTTNIKLDRVPAIVLDYVEHHFQPFVGYCRNQEYQNRICEEQQETNPAFKEALIKLQNTAAARRLPFVSFLLLPMQRVTRMPILLKGIEEATPKTDGAPSERVLLTKACAAVKKFVVRCDNEAEYMKSMEETIKIKTQLDFGRLKPCQLIVEGRQLLSSLDMTWHSDDRKSSRTDVKLHIFTDLVLLTRPSKKGRPAGVFKAVDYCLKSVVIVDDEPAMASLSLASVPSGRLYRSSSEPGINRLNVSQSLTAVENLYVRITMLENSEKTKTSYLLEAKSITDKTRCLKTLPQPDKDMDKDDERIYEDWDCPEVVVLHEYLSTKPDVLSLVPGDHIRILRKMPDGWCHGKLVHSDQEGWFHSTYVKEKTTEHTRARTLKAQHRLLEALSDTKMHKQYSAPTIPS